ncbi:MAG: uracil-DNA glycosylase family protein [Beijerinckiaceae bacterium]
MTHALDTLVAELHACRICRDAPQYGAALPHEPRPVIQASRTARLLIAGQAPGTRVQASGRPFTDPSGDRLRRWLGMDEAAFYDASRVAIVPMGHCFPGLDAKGGDLPPRRECAPRWRVPILAALPEVRVVLAIGKHAQDWHLPALAGLDLAGRVRVSFEAFASGESRIFAMPHPSWRNNSWLTKHPWFEAECLPVLRTALQDISEMQYLSSLH